MLEYFKEDIYGLLSDIIKRLKEGEITLNKFIIFLRLLNRPDITDQTKLQLSHSVASSRLSSRTLAGIETIVKGKEGKHRDAYSLLEKYEFFDNIRTVLLDKVLNPNASFSFANSRVELVLWYLRNFGVDEDIVAHILETFPNLYTPHPFDVAKGLKRYFQDNPAEWDIFVKIATTKLNMSEESLRSLAIYPEFKQKEES